VLIRPGCSRNCARVVRFKVGEEGGVSKHIRSSLPSSDSLVLCVIALGASSLSDSPGGAGMSIRLGCLDNGPEVVLVEGGQG
jgi:hypothetical protein